MDDHKVSPHLEDNNVPAVTLESEAWLAAQLAHMAPSARYAVGSRVVAARTIIGCNVRLPRGTPGTITAVRTGDTLKTEYVVDWQGLSYPSFEDSPDGKDDPQAALEFLLRFMAHPKTVHHTSLYAVPERAVRPAGQAASRR